MSLIFGDAFPFIGLLYGKKYSGKSVLIKYLIWTYREKFSYIVVFSATAEANDAYSFLPKEFVHSKFEPEVLKNIIAKQLKAVKNCKTPEERAKAPQVLIVFDDCIGMEGLDWRKKNNNELKLLFSSNRHWNISMLISSQGVKEIPPLLRMNCDGAFIFRSLNNSLEDLYTCYSTMPRKQFYEFVHNNTNDWKIIMYNTREQDRSKIFTIFKVPESIIKKQFRLVY